ncbi:hypothetical protein TWF281_009778 [Arthrobotrys megalospora]
MLLEISAKLTNLKCLQVVEILSDISLLEESLKKLPPLEALYIAIIQKDGQLDYGCLDKHQSSIKRLVFVTGSNPAWREGSHSTLRGPNLRRAKIDFRAWRQLEELTFHCGGDLPFFYLPPSLKFLNVVDPRAKEKDHIYTYDELLRAYTTQQMNAAKSDEWKLKAVIVNSALSLPNDFGLSFKILETAAEKSGPLPTLKVKVLEAAMFFRKFSGTSILRPKTKSRARSWINQIA